MIINRVSSTSGRVKPFKFDSAKMDFYTCVTSPLPVDLMSRTNKLVELLNRIGFALNADRVKLN